jgi:hypothetical protein
MGGTKRILLQGFGLILCAALILSCHSNKVVSSYGKRKYTKGWFLFKRKSVDSRAAKGKDTSLTHTYVKLPVPENKNPVSTVAPIKEDEQGHKKHHAKKDSANANVKSNLPETAQKVEKDKTKTPEPPDPILLKLLVLIIVLAGISVFTTGLITPIIVWGISQNFLLATGLALSFFALLLSVDTTLGIYAKTKGDAKQYNLGKPAWILSLWATPLVAFLYATVKTSLISNLLLVQISTIGLFFAGASVLLSVILAIKALCVDDRHKGKAVFALVIDALLITAGILLFL